MSQKRVRNRAHHIYKLSVKSKWPVKVQGWLNDLFHASLISNKEHCHAISFPDCWSIDNNGIEESMGTKNGRYGTMFTLMNKP